MKKLFALASLLLSTTAFADIHEITIDNIVRIGHRTISNPMMFEVCGRVRADEPVVITINSDYGTVRVAPYTLKPNELGQYCHIVANFTGRIQAVAKPVHGNSGGVDTGIKFLKDLKSR